MSNVNTVHKIASYLIIAIVFSRCNREYLKMAATLKDILGMIARDQERQKEKPKRHTKVGTKIAMDILHHYKFPDDNEPKQDKDAK